jgi:glycosyl hydrolase family 45
MLVPKLRHGLGLALVGMTFVLPLSSCFNTDANSGTVTGSSGMSSTTAGRPTTVGSAGTPTTTAGSGAGTTVGGSGGAPSAAGGMSTVGVGGQQSNSAGAGGMAPACTNKQVPGEHEKESCSIWPEWDATKGPGEAKDCDASWLTGAGYCLESCGKCKPSSGSGGSSSSSTGGSGSGSGTGGGFSTGLGPGPALPTINTSNKLMWASRYWDCCKPHCSTNGNIKSCGSDGVSQNGGSSACAGGSAYACYSQAPRAIGDNVSYGHVAVPNPSCGTCYHLQFAGTGQHNANDPGSKNLAGKHMIVKVTNTGGDVAGNQFDLMIPGGGVGQNPNTCPTQWKMSASDMGSMYGGFLSACTGSYDAKKACVREKCMKLPEGDARKGCIWFVDWYQAADNPQFRYESIACPSDI